jgi:hypothetical protein
VRALMAVAIIVPVTTWGGDLRAVTPPCASPSRLKGQFDATANVVTAKLKHDTVNAEAVAMTLAKKYGVIVRWGYYDGWSFVPPSGFSTSGWTPDKIAQIRCEPGVDVVVLERPEPVINETATIQPGP